MPWEIHSRLYAAMFKRTWCAGLAIGLGLGVGLSLFFLVWAVPEFRSPALAEQYYQNWQATSESGQNQNPNDTHFWVRELYGWVYAEDTLAQWLMAILGFAATAISLYALIWLRRTWDQTKRSADAAWKAVGVTRKIGEAQTRAYISIEPMKFGEPDIGRRSYEIQVKINNTGATPARNLAFQVKFFVAPHDDDTAVMPSFKASFPDVGEMDFQLGGNAEHTSYITTEAFSAEDRSLMIKHTTHRLYIVGRVSYDDVFGAPHKTYITAYYRRTGRIENQRRWAHTWSGIGTPIEMPPMRINLWDWVYTAKGNSAD